MAKRPKTDEEKRIELEAALAAMRPKPEVPGEERGVSSWVEPDGTVVVKLTGERRTA